MHYRVPILLLFCAPVVGCFQEVNTGAATGSAPPPTGGGNGGTPTPAPRGGGGTVTPPPPRGGGGGGAGGGGGTVTPPVPDAGMDPPMEEEEITVIGTPEIEFVTPDGGAATSTDPCEVTAAHATTILLQNCTPCHGGGPGRQQGVPPFDYVLDFERLMTARSTTTPDPTAPPENQIPGTATFEGMRFAIPGDPINSRIYFRMARKEMPPLPVDGAPDTLRFRPTISDFSVIHEWIANCLEAPEEPEGDAGDPGDDGGADPGDDGGADPGDDGGADPAP